MKPTVRFPNTPKQKHSKGASLPLLKRGTLRQILPLLGGVVGEQGTGGAGVGLRSHSPWSQLV